MNWFVYDVCGYPRRAVGSLTGNLVTRQTYYERPCIMALIPFLNRGMFTDPGTVTTVQDTTVAAPPSEPVCTLVRRLLHYFVPLLT